MNIAVAEEPQQRAAAGLLRDRIVALQIISRFVATGFALQT
jgi:hypothetical protein